jgi:uncharacterized protein (DUF302 family)
METKNYGLFIETKRDFDAALAAIIGALKEQGFGVLTEIDVKATMKQKLDVDFRRYRILGACNPPLAHRALSTELDIGLLLPSNVVVYDNEDGSTTVAALDPAAMMGFTGNEALTEVAIEARCRVEAALRSLQD